MPSLLVCAVNRVSACSSLLRFLILSILASCLSGIAHSQAPALVVDGPATLTTGGTINIGSWSSNNSGGSSLVFHFTQPVTITSVAYDSGPNGVSELAVGRTFIAGGSFGSTCIMALTAGQQCGVDTAFTPLFPGIRSGTLRITTTSGGFIIPVTFAVIKPQIALTPGALTSPVSIAGQQLTTTGTSIALDAAGNLYLADTSHAVVRKVDATTGVAAIYAGTLNNPNKNGDGGPATSADIQYPIGVTVSPAGDLYILSIFPLANNPVRKVDLATGDISTVATEISGRAPTLGNSSGNGTDGGIAVDPNGSIYVAVPTRNEIVVFKNGVFTTLVQGAQYAPTAMTLGGGYLYFASNHQVFKVSTDPAQPQSATPVAGTGADGNSGDWAPATSALIGTISGLALDAAGNLYLADSENATVRVVNASTGSISPLAGAGSYLYSVTVAPGLSSLALDVRGNLYILATDGTVQKVDVSQASLAYADTAVGSTSSDSAKYVSATNIGNDFLPAGSTSVPVGFTIDPSSICFDAKGAYGPLGTGGSCFEAINFSPVTAGNIAAQIGFGGSTINLSGKATSSFVISPSSIDFGSIRQGDTSGTWTINIGNTSAQPLQYTGGAQIDATDFLVTNNCLTIPAYSSCNFTVVFRPLKTGVINGSIILNFNAGSQTVTLTGTGTPSYPDLVVSPTSIDFGNIPVGQQSPSWQIYVGNNGPNPIALLDLILAPPLQFKLTGSTCGSSLPAYGNCLFSVAFTPAAAQAYTSQVSVAINPTNSIGGGSQTNVALTGTGTALSPPSLQVAPSPMDFGNVPVGGNSGTWTLWIGNSGGSPVRLHDLALSDTINFTLSKNCVVIAAYGSCTESVTFNPHSQGPLNATIAVTNYVTSATQTVALSGVGTDPSYTVRVNPTALTLHNGDTSLATFTFLPAGGFTGSLAFVCNGLPAGTTCTFSPATLTADGSNTPQTSKLTITTRTLVANRGTYSGIAFAGILGLLGAGFMRRRRSSLRTIMAAIILLIGIATLNGCGSGISGSLTPLGTYAVQVAATATAMQKTQTGTAPTGTTTQTAPFSLTVIQ